MLFDIAADALPYATLAAVIAIAALTAATIIGLPKLVDDDEWEDIMRQLHKPAHGARDRTNQTTEH